MHGDYDDDDDDDDDDDWWWCMVMIITTIIIVIIMHHLCFCLIRFLIDIQINLQSLSVINKQKAY